MRVSQASVKMTAFGKLCLFATVACAVASMQTNNVVQFGEMIRCLTDRSFINSFLDYEGYGCWCGFGGKGTPLDGTDNCCMIHDKCYDAATDSGICPFDEYVYVVLYIASTYDCGTPNGAVTCMKANDYGRFRLWTDCSETICECDRAAAECFAKNAFDDSLKNWPKDNCY